MIVNLCRLLQKSTCLKIRISFHLCDKRPLEKGLLEKANYGLMKSFDDLSTKDNSKVSLKHIIRFLWVTGFMMEFFFLLFAR